MYVVGISGKIDMYDNISVKREILMTDIINSLRTWVEVDLDALDYNLEIVRDSLPAGAKILGVVKANAYGHGAVRVSAHLEGRVDYLAVAAPDEAIELRKNGIKTPILILGHIPKGEYDNMVKYDITPTISDLTEARLLCEAALCYGKEVPFHIAVDTGMSRIGFAPTMGSVEEIAEICKFPSIVPEGIFSHFAAADTIDKAYTEMQRECFDTFVALLAEKGVNPPVKHLYNSAAIADLTPDYDMVREGIILYGLNPSREVEYKNIPRPKPVMSMKTRVVQVKTLLGGVSVSYGCTYTTEKETVVATLCAGYADGVPRALSNKGSVIINGYKAPIIGRVCMDQFMVDVTNIPDVTTDSVATIFGAEGDAQITAEDIADMTGTIPYEIVCNMNSRVVRVYIKNGKIHDTFSYLPME